MSRRAIVAVVILAWLGTASSTVGQTASGAARFHLDFARWAWPTPAAERRERGVLDSVLVQLYRLSRIPPQSAPALRRMLVLADSAAMLVAWHANYWHVRSSLDTRDREGVQVEDSLYRAQDSVFAAVNRQVAAFDQGQLQRLLGSDPTVARYRRFIEDVRGAKPSTTSLQSAPLAAVATSWQFALYERLIDATDFGTVAGPAGPVDVRRGWYTIQASADSAARAAAFDKLYAGYAKNRDLLSFALVETVRAQQEVARLAGFRDRPSQAYQGRGLTTDEVRGLIAVVRSRGDIARRFERADAAARRATVGIPPPNLTLDDAAATMVETFGSLGPQLHREAQALLDPTGGRLEIGGGEHARAGGFSFTLRGDVTGVYLDHFGGTPAEVSRLMHESGHAVHRSLFLATAANHLQGPSLSEVVALFGEILLADRLATAAKTPADSVFWRRQFLAKMLEVFYGANDAELEQAVYDSISAGMSGTADELDRVTRGVDSAYTIERRPVAAGRWMRANLLFEDPLYLSNYLYSGLICVELYWQHQSNPVGFVANYLKFLRDTGDGSPKEIISRDFGLRLDDPSVLASGFKLLDSLVGEFETEVDRGVRR